MTAPESTIVEEVGAALNTTGTPGHGVRLTLRGRCPEGTRFDSRDMHIDFHGARLWNVFPLMVQSLSGTVLPIRLREATWATDGETFTLEIVLGKYRLSHETFETYLKKLQDDGNPPFVTEIADAAGGVAILFTITAGEVLESLSRTKRSEGGETTFVKLSYPPTLPSDYAAAIERVGRRGGAGALKWMRWLACPTLFVAAHWALYTHPAEVLAKVPGVLARMGTSLTQVLPIHPKNLSEAYQYGRLSALLEVLSPGADQAPILQAAARLAGRAVTGEELGRVGATVAEMEARVGVVSRVRGMFSLINLVWLGSIGGITLSCGPAIWSILRPLHQHLRRLVQTIVLRVINPTVSFCHRWGLIEAANYAACFVLTADGYRLSPEHRDAGTFISLSGLALAAGPCFAYSSALHAVDILRRLPHRTSAQLEGLFVAALAAPLALARESTLLGYITAFGLYGAAGFSVVSRGLCWLVGFHDKKALHVSNVIAAASLVAFSSVDVLTAQDSAVRRVLTPFRSAGFVMSGIVHYLAMLIMTSELYLKETSWSYWYNPKPYSRRYWKMQARMVASLAAGLTVGHLKHLPGLANTCTTFAVLYLTEKWIELHRRFRYNTWVLVLLLSLGTYKASLFFHSNPQFIAAMLA
eukprot:TRINITY_DN32416_c0_g1_i1.p1 TRINITY_DN32416_c0_g1~~TRINITY_DN32416_c0_g1_i1.p1  ORF type:complete len:641 (+),score=148.11 TRINITY_DN32416_c0_g1_i1:63-1985(+)